MKYTTIEQAAQHLSMSVVELRRACEQTAAKDQAGNVARFPLGIVAKKIDGVWRFDFHEPCERCGGDDWYTFFRNGKEYHECRACMRARNRQYRIDNPERRRANRAKYKQRHPEKVRAHNAAYKAQRRGTLTPHPCEVCSNPDAEKHHADYSKHLDVRWLCKTCHGKQHTKRRAA